MKKGLQSRKRMMTGKMKKKKFRKKLLLPIVFTVILFTAALGWVAGVFVDKGPNQVFSDIGFSAIGAEHKIDYFAKQNGLERNDWPAELIEMLENNPDAEDFVLNYPLKKDYEYDIDLSKYEDTFSVPLLFQWDERWGYSMYCGELMGLSGCGPVCLSMVCIYLLNDGGYHPKFIAEFAEKEGYATDGDGSSWELISKGGEKLGLDVVEIPLDENRVIDNLKVGNPIICVMGPGDFTTTGHFIVMTEYKEGKIKINDPNSKLRSEKLWYFDDIKCQIRNLWVCR